MEPDDLEAAASFLEDYAIRPPRPEAHHPAADSERWREIRQRLNQLARSLRAAGGQGKGVFLESDAQFLDTQSSRLYRMHHWVLRDPTQTPAGRQVAEIALGAAQRLQLIAGIVRARIS